MSADAVTTRAAVKTITLFTHTHPEQTAAALRETIEIATRLGATVSATPEEREKHGDAAAGCEEATELPEKPDLCLVLGGGSAAAAACAFAIHGLALRGVQSPGIVT